MATRGCSATIKGKRCGRAPSFQCWECGDRFCVVKGHAEQCTRCWNHICSKHLAGHRGDPELCKSIFRLESHLQSTMRHYLDRLEPGLVPRDGGRERRVGSGKRRTDIKAFDAKKKPVIVELKAVKAGLDALEQIRDYMKKDEQKNRQGPVRGILVAKSFLPDVIKKAKLVPKVQLREYSFQFEFPPPK